MKIPGQTDSHIPVLEGECFRVWPWLTFNFMSLVRTDRTNQKWKALRSAIGRRIDMPYPNENYYRALQGDPAEYGLSLKDN